MARPRARDLTEREVEVMHVFWERGEQTALQVKGALASAGLDLAYPTVANLVRGLAEKGFLTQTNAERPFSYRAAQSYETVSGRLLRDVVERLFHGSREQLLVRLMSPRRLTARERVALQAILQEGQP